MSDGYARMKHMKKQCKNVRKKCIVFILAMLGIACICYAFALFFTGFGGYLSFVWLVPAGLSFFFVQILRGRIIVRKWMKKLMLWILVPLVSLFLITEAVIVSGFFDKSDKEPDYIVVLGTTVYRSGPCYLLRQRLQEAAKWSKEYEDAVIVVTGGQGKTEPFPEGTEMKRYLVEELGIDEKRIYVEDKSINTFENMTFTGKILEEEFVDFSYKDSSVLLVTNNFHMFRAKKIAQKAGYENVTGAAAETLIYLFPHYMVREFFSIAKNLVLGRM